MSLTSLSFIGLYFPLLVIVCCNPVIRNNTFRKLILAGTGLGLYVFSAPEYVLLLACVILYSYFLVKLAKKTGQNFFRAAAVVLDVLLLLAFKYVNILLSFADHGSMIERITFPVGLSYYMFKAISYAVDSRKEKQGTLLDVTVYISNFLTIVSGPLSLYGDELPYIREKRPGCEHDAIYKGLERFIIGFGKKVIIADSLTMLVKQCFASSGLSIVMAWSGAAAYTLQLFFDFSGYTDMAIGIGYLLGFHLPENFNYPYMASSVSDFWKRWHISLTKWFAEYVYFPLGGSRVKSTARHVFNLFAVWLITGMWHGSSATFILWAMIYFVLQLLEKFTGWADLLKKIHLGHPYTLLVVVVEWIIFRSGSLSHALYYLRSMFFLNQNAFVNPGDFSVIARYAVPFSAGVLFSTDAGRKIKNLASENVVANGFYDIGLIVLFAVSMVITVSQGFTAPLYAGF